MPTYDYKCPVCEKIRTATHGMQEDPEFYCDSCDTSQDILMYRVIKPSMFTIRHGMRGDMRDYREDLARFAGDPRAFVDGPRSLQKLIDQTKREGADVRPLSEAAAGAPPSVEDEDEESENLLAEAEAEARQEIAEEG